MDMYPRHADGDRPRALAKSRDHDLYDDVSVSPTLLGRAGHLRGRGRKPDESVSSDESTASQRNRRIRTSSSRLRLPRRFMHLPAPMLERVSEKLLDENRWPLDTDSETDSVNDSVATERILGGHSSLLDSASASTSDSIGQWCEDEHLERSSRRRPHMRASQLRRVVTRLDVQHIINSDTRVSL